MENLTIKVWLGTFSGTWEEYQAYFDQSNDISPFGKDIDQSMNDYDPDFIGVLPLSPSEIDIKELIKQCPLGLDASIKLMENCYKYGITIANVIMFYSGETRHIEVGEIFHQLLYMGEFPLL